MGCLALQRGAALVTAADAAWVIAAIFEADDAITGAMLLDAARAVIADRLRGGHRSTATFLERLEGHDGRRMVAPISRIPHFLKTQALLPLPPAHLQTCSAEPTHRARCGSLRSLPSCRSRGRRPSRRGAPPPLPPPLSSPARSSPGKRSVAAPAQRLPPPPLWPRPPMPSRLETAPGCTATFLSVRLLDAHLPLCLRPMEGDDPPIAAYPCCYRPDVRHIGPPFLPGALVPRLKMSLPEDVFRSPRVAQQTFLFDPDDGE